MSEPQCDSIPAPGRLEVVSYLVMENNRMQPEDVLQTGTIDVTPSYRQDVRAYHQVTFHYPFDTDDVAVITTIQTRNDDSFFITRMRNVNANGFQIEIVPHFEFKISSFHEL